MNRRFVRVGVLMGGFSAEREVSLKSGAAVARGLTEAGYDAVKVDVTGPDLDLPDAVEAVFVALHGTFGEDGTVQALLADRGISFTGSGAVASRLAFDKAATKTCLESHNIPTPAFQLLRNGETPRIGLPAVVKPTLQGSSIGLHFVTDESDWAAALADAASYEGQVLVESFIEGSEFTVGIVGDEMLPIVEIKAPGGRYDFEAKYASTDTEYLVPAPLPEDRARSCRDLAIATFRALGCTGLGRVDFRMDAEGRLYVLEVNTIPGFTETSLLPKAANAAGISFSELCGRIMEGADV